MTRILDLLRKIEAEPAHTAHLVDVFLQKHGSPFVQDGEATFLLKGRFDSVSLVHWVFGLESRLPFKRFPGTDAWYLSIELPADSRIEYKLEVTRHGQTDWIKDPHNPHLAYDPFGANSVIRMDGYDDPPWALAEPHVRAGTMEGLTVTSAAFGDQRDVQVWLPYEFRKEKTWPLLIVHDGHDYLKYTGMRTILENLVHRHEMRPLVVAFINGVQRNEEYGANPLHPRFVAEDVLPALQREFRISEDPALRGLMGASFGGVASLYTAWNYPSLFGQLFCQSGSFVFTDIGHHGRAALWDPVVDFMNEFRTNPGRIDSRLYLSCGVFESLISYNRSLVPLLRDAGLEHRFRESRDGHNWICWRDHMRAGLTWLFPGHLWMTYD